jgi:hypothetical protein
VSTPAFRPTQPPVQWILGVLSRGKTRPGRDADHLPHLVKMSRISGSYISFRTFFSLKTLDDGYSPKARFFEMHHTIVRTLQNRAIYPLTLGVCIAVEVQLYFYF